MIKSIHLENFKSFKDATLELGSFSVLVGANASGKSNLFDAFRFLDGLIQGYSIGEIIGGKKISEGRDWEGIRGGTRGVTWNKAPGFIIRSVLFDMNKPDETFIHEIEVDVSSSIIDPSIKREPMIKNGEPFKKYYHAEPNISLLHWMRLSNELRLENPEYTLILDRLYFYNLLPNYMRNKSSSSKSLNHDGGNISAVLYKLCTNERKKNDIKSWLQELTPMDAVDIEFYTDDPTGKVLLMLKEKSGSLTSAYSASDGTLRFLGFLAALLDAEEESVLFFEEIENGIHPSRLHLLVQLIEQTVKQRNIQVIATTHSPLLLGYLSEETVSNSSLLYRLEGRDYTEIKRINDIPNAVKLIKKFGLMDLHMSSWFENTVSCLDDTEDD